MDAVHAITNRGIQIPRWRSLLLCDSAGTSHVAALNEERRGNHSFLAPIFMEKKHLDTERAD